MKRALLLTLLALVSYAAPSHAMPIASSCPGGTITGQFNFVLAPDFNTPGDYILVEVKDNSDIEVAFVFASQFNKGMQAGILRAAQGERKTIEKRGVDVDSSGNLQERVLWQATILEDQSVEVRWIPTGGDGESHILRRIDVLNQQFDTCLNFNTPIPGDSAPSAYLRKILPSVSSALDALPGLYAMQSGYVTLAVSVVQLNSQLENVAKERDNLRVVFDRAIASRNQLKDQNDALTKVLAQFVKDTSKVARSTRDYGSRKAILRSIKRLKAELRQND